MSPKDRIPEYVKKTKNLKNLPPTTIDLLFPDFDEK
jgi:hypothetical protein